MKKFLKQLSKINSIETADLVRKAISNVESASSISQISHLKKLKGYSNYYRIKIGDFRIGILLEQNIIDFVCLMHRKEIYVYFP